MAVHQDSITFPVGGRGLQDITREVAQIVGEANVQAGLATVFIHHTSASLVICENADPAVRRDLERWMERVVPDGDVMYEHTAEGPDDMPAHVRCALTQTSIGIPVLRGTLDLGMWQGVYLYEHRYAAHRRRVSVVIIGE